MTAAMQAAGWVLGAAGAAVAVALRVQLRTVRELVTRASHEIRGPLAAGQLALDAAVAAGELPRARADAVGAQLRRACRALEDLSLAPARRSAAHEPRPVPAQRLLEAAATAWAPVAAARGRELRSRVDAGDAPHVWIDPVRFDQAVGNLVANALEHGAGPVELRLRAAGGRARFEVRDAGGGLPAPLGRLIASARGGRGMRGRGLAVAADVAARHGGRLVAAPSAGGAVLALELPLGRAAAEAGEPAG